MSRQNFNPFQAGTAPTSFAGVTSPWHRVWEPLSKEESQDVDAAMTRGGIAWGVKKIQLHHPVTNEPIPAFGTFREDTEGFLGVVGERYEPIGNRESMQFLKDIVGTDNIVIDSCGCFNGGAKVFANLKVGTFEVVPGDETEVYYQFVNAHDGSMHLSVFQSYIRMVCGNTVRHAMAQAQRKLKIRHTKGGVSSMENVVEWLKIAGQEQQEFNNKLKFLATKRMKEDLAEIFMDRLLGKLEVKTKKNGEAKSNRNERLRGIILNSEGVDGVQGIAGTFYEKLNQVTRALDHNPEIINGTQDRKGIGQIQAHAVNTSFGTYAAKKSKAFDLLFEMAKNA